MHPHTLVLWGTKGTQQELTLFYNQLHREARNTAESRVHIIYSCGRTSGVPLSQAFLHVTPYP